MNSPSPLPFGVIGLGRSGVAAVRFLNAHGQTVLAWDTRKEPTLPVSGLPGVATLDGNPLPATAFLGCQAILLSPGVPRAMPELQPILQAGIPVINDVEWLHDHVRRLNPQAMFIGITGSNGKSTVTTLIGEMLQQQGLATAVGGNLGTPALELFQPEHRAYVLELSSFQLESIAAFRAEISLFLNLTPDHLDRYPDLDAYGEAKRRIHENARPGDRVILNGDDPWLSRDRQACQARGLVVVPFSIQGPMPGGVYAHDGWLIDGRQDSPRPLLPLDRIRIRGAHNQANAAAAAAAALSAGVEAETVATVLATFPGLPHRMEHVRHLDGVDYCNDSKGTNVGATLMSLQSFAPPDAQGGGVVLIAGGRDKKGDFTALAPVAARVVTDAILMGEAANDLAAALVNGPRLHRVQEMTGAVRLARSLAGPGQT
ncbi:MAG: UDP-N-acetylmuramoyl-L-alanine--D-glutamate ligase, partial [Magnetococcales bacterium]|nr:UDP-N-acetylmuramoyl-L-alanine--D-glutamate ligase [Magnetococcales bacterium]